MSTTICKSWRLDCISRRRGYLFMGTVFCIDSVQKMTDDEIWKVRLKLGGDEDAVLKTRSGQMKTQLGDMNDLNTLSVTLLIMGENEKAENFLRMILNDTPADNPTIATAYDSMTLLSFPPNHPDRATTCNNIAEMYRAQVNYDTALEYHEKALELRLVSVPPNHPHPATTYNNMAILYRAQGKYNTALKYH
ncbi:unnamed protein product [Didymodactylos carnosus]|uniref:Uncharacterized protein n=1 Tax=Didymodactylos carnosus TaxID=1234261 RepID=A0A815DUC7_9BILA|nr:unnamed protein product [Didymodactylos carnosus]CAF1298197.1 unnamed protein product [Didymodactylos carnosus]CAF3977364.1 unnamed protein product [Didymodactylos carnosus]CAF4116647.1 unnamed protein product [Didymodactylos carnosus]